MNTFTWIGVVILLLGWIGLIIIALSYKSEDTKRDKLQSKSHPKADSDNQLKTDTPV